MILQDSDIKDILLNRPNRKLVTAAQDYTRKLLMHIKGVGLDRYIELVNMFEKPDLVTIRKKYAVSNKHLFERVHRPKDNVFEATGGSVYYDIPEAKKTEFTKLMSNLVYGFSIKKWLKTFWIPAVEYDPMGLIMIEVDALGNAYPTYKSIMDVYDYKLNGRDVEYVIFKVEATPEMVQQTSQTAQVYRVVDDISDKLVTLSGANMTVLAKDSFPNYFMKVPALVISSIYDPVLGFWISADDAVIELADQFLTQGSVKNIYKNYFGFPNRWEYASACPVCHGEGVSEGRTCDTCKGTGTKSKTDVSETIRVPVPQSNDSVKLAPELAGYITPDIQGWNKMDEELKMLEALIFQTKWGTHQMQEDKNNTATGKFIDVQPVNNALCAFSDAAETMETFVTDMIGQFKYGSSYNGCSIVYGKRFILESADDLWAKVQEGIKFGAPTSALYDMYSDYLQSRYNTNSLEMQKQVKLSKIEPFPFTTYDQLAKVPNFPQDILLKKTWFEGWMNSKTEQEITYGDLKQLQDDFAAYCEEMNSEVEEKNAEKVATQQQMMQEQGQEGGAAGENSKGVGKTESVEV